MGLAFTFIIERKSVSASIACCALCYAMKLFTISSTSPEHLISYGIALIESIIYAAPPGE